MNHRECIVAAIRHQPVDRIPTDIWATPEVWATLRKHFGVNENLKVYDALDIDGIIGIAPPYVGPALRVEGDYHENEWGMGFRSQHYGTGAYDEQVRYPLAEARTVDDLERYAWPSPDWYDYASLPRLAQQVGERAVEVGYTALFYYHNLLRGLELSLIDPLERPEFTHCLIQKLSDFFNAHHRRCYEATRGLIDTTQVTDDWGSQHGLLSSKRVFDAFYRAPMQRAIDLAKQYGIHVFHHDDGDMRALLPTFVEMGIDILNPVQWRCGDWDLPALKKQFGARICFHSAVDNQETLPFGSPQDVRGQVALLIQALASDQTGFIIGPCHNLQPVAPVENILALYDAAKEYGTFR
jgi:uroporphyrinogen decarboxylase